MRDISINAAAIIVFIINISALAALYSFFPFFSIKNKEVFLFIFSAVSYIFLHAKFNKFISAPYIAAHELSHALFGMISGNKIYKIKLGKDFGYVKFKNKTGFATSMAPYFFPIYAILTAFIYWIISLFKETAPIRPYFIFAEGFFLSFHAINTVSVMTTSIQSDFKKTKKTFFAYSSVIFINILTLAFVIKLLFSKEVSLKIFFLKTWNYFFVIINTCLKVFLTVFYFIKDAFF